jgi:hypothetical protein
MDLSSNVPEWIQEMLLHEPALSFSAHFPPEPTVVKNVIPLVKKPAEKKTTPMTTTPPVLRSSLRKDECSLFSKMNQFTARTSRVYEYFSWQPPRFVMLHEDIFACDGLKYSKNRGNPGDVLEIARGMELEVTTSVKIVS